MVVINLYYFYTEGENLVRVILLYQKTWPTLKWTWEPSIQYIALAAEGDEEQYEDPDKLARHGRRGLRERYAPAVQDSTPSPYELPLSSAETHVGSSSMPAAGPAYATADEVGRSWKDTKIAADNMTAEASQYY